MRINKSKSGGFTLVEIMIVVAIIGLLAAIAIPNFVRARATSQANACINNLRQIDGAIQQWALENKQAPGASVSYTDIVGYLKNSVICPSGGTTFANSYTISTVTNKPSCTIGSQFTPTAHLLPPDTTG
jgi:prepilin-type N-terminal cleavage/methylation domain-containing protein